MGALAGLQRVSSRARALESPAADERGDPELDVYLLRRGHTELLFYVVLEIYFAIVLQRLQGSLVHLRSSAEQLNKGFIVCSEDFLVRADGLIFGHDI